MYRLKMQKRRNLKDYSEKLNIEELQQPLNNIKISHQIKTNNWNHNGYSISSCYTLIIIFL
jgi:hypothetical protein